MKMCSYCQTANPDSANYCMACGNELEAMEAESKPDFSFAGLNMFALSLIGSIALSLVLIFVFRIPVFFLAAFLPLLWAGSKKKK
jgi:hypothetical protein